MFVKDSLHADNKNIVLSDDDLFNRFSQISSFILDSQKQYVETMKFSLNIWTIVSSGSALAIAVHYDVSMYKLSFLLFILSSISSMIGIIIMHSFTGDVVYNSKLYVFHDINYSTYIEKHFNHYIKSKKYTSFLLFISYSLFIFSIFSIIVTI